MEPRIQYAKTRDGVSIAYWTLGHGEPFVMCLSPGVSHIQKEWDIPEARWAYEELARHRTLVRLDFRNSGLSTRGVGDTSLDAYVLDLAAVVDHLESDRCSISGGTYTSKVVTRFVVDHPESVSRVVFVRPTVAAGSQHSPLPLAGLGRLVETDWDLYCEVSAVAMAGLENPEFTRRVARLMRDARNPKDFSSQEALTDVDVTDSLKQIRVPVLLIHRMSKEFDIEISRSIAAELPNARMAALDGRMTFPWDEPAVRAIEEFLSEGQDRQRELPSGTALILFADIANSTLLTEQLGDAPFREKARALDGAVRTAIRKHGGTPVEGKLLGDGVLAVFTSARQAIEAALACGRSGVEAGLPLHLGLHAGDVIREEGNVYGGAVNIASRISGLSAAGEVLVSETVRSLARTSAGVRFEDRGEQALKGVGEAVRVWAVRES